MIGRLGFISLDDLITELARHGIVTALRASRLCSYGRPYMLAITCDLIFGLNTVNCYITIYNGDNRL